MKKLNLIMLIAFSLLCGIAHAASPIYFSCDFSGTGFNSLPEGWLTYGSGHIPSKSMQSFFNKDGSGPYYIPMIAEDGTSHKAAFSNSSFSPSAQADEWLVSPQIEIPSDIFVVGFTVYANGSAEQSNYEIYVSEGGDSKADFGTTPVHTGNIDGSLSKIIAKKDAFALSGYKGKKIRLAFVNRNTDRAFLGFSDIQVGQYIVAVTNNTPRAVYSKDPITVSLTADILMPVSNVNGFNATLTADNGKTLSYVSHQKLGETLTQVSFDFPEQLDIYRVGDPINYNITFTPNFEGAIPVEIAGSVSCRLSYPSVCVVEEITGTWCSNCPKGIAALNRFHDEYSERCFTIAVHGGEQDPMKGASGFYLNNLVSSVLGAANYPYASFNRKTKSEKIADMSLVEDQLKNNSDCLAEMLEVAYDKDLSKEVTATFNVRLGYSDKDLRMSVCVIVVEDEVKGTGVNYNQKNGYNKAGKASIDKEFGEGWWPYFEEFYGAGPQVPASKMVYNHVARGIYNNFYGNSEILSKEWKGDIPQTVRVKFEMPDIVNNWANTSMIALVLDPGGKIVAASRMKAADYVKVSAMPEVLATAIAVEPESKTMDIGETLNLTWTVEPADVSNGNVQWSTSDKNVATVNNGSVKAISAGETIIKATTTDGTNLSAECKITVVGVDAESITIDPTDKTVKTGETFWIQAVVKPDNATDKEVVWSSDNPDIASVTQNGLVSALKKGEATITASAAGGSLTAQCKVTVDAPVQAVNDVVSDDTEIIVKGGIVTIKGLEEGTGYSVSTADGLIIRSGYSQGEIVNIEGLPSGIYIVSLPTGHTKVVIR